MIDINEKTVQRLYYLLFTVYAGCMMPLVWIGFYNWPSADDYSMAFEVHEVFAATGSVFSAFAEGIRMAYHYYMNWTGYYFSDFVTAMAPSVFGERLYVWTTVIVLGVFTFGMLYFFHALFTKYYGVQWHLAGSIAFLVMLLIVQCMPAEGGVRVEAFYWWAGACNYMLMWSLGVLWCGLLISCRCDSGKKRVWEYLCACVLGLLLGGANYMTGLTLAIVSVVGIVGVVTTHLPILPCLLNLAGFAAACLAPGNQVRGAIGEGFPAVKSIVISLYYTLSYCVSDWTTWVVLCCLLLLLPLLWMAAGESEGTGTLTHFSEKRVSVPVPLTHFRHPIIACVLAYGLISANMTPILFTRGDIGAGRMQSIIWAQYILLLVLAVFYVLGHAAGRLKSVKKRFFKNFEEAAVKARLLRGYVAVVLVLFVAGSALSLGVNSHFYSSASAATDLVNGNAVRYRTESEERLAVLLTDDKNPVIPAYSVRPELLFFSDITPDETEWINTAMAEYYHKDTVRVGNE